MVKIVLARVRQYLNVAQLSFECKGSAALARFPVKFHIERSQTHFYCVKNFYNVSSINLNPKRLLSAMLKMYFIFVRRDCCSEKEKKELERRRGQNPPLDFRENEGLFC